MVPVVTDHSNVRRARHAATPLFFDCEGDSLLGLVESPERPCEVGVVVLVGGPQYRVGSHRHFVHLARDLVAAGYAVLRFDFRGMGDSEGDPVPLVETGAEVQAAVDALCASAPDVRTVVLWGLCDGATAAGLAARRDPRIGGVVLVNPWVRTTSGESETIVKHYYARRLLMPGFWRKLVRGRFEWRRAIGEAWTHVRQARRVDGSGQPTLAHRLATNLMEAQTPALVILSGRDATAAEFALAGTKPGPLRTWLSRPAVTVRRIEQADHTFSQEAWRAQADGSTLEWLAAIRK